MSRRETAFALVAVYGDPDAARADVEIVEELATDHDLRLHDIAIVRHEEGGTITTLQRDARSSLHGAEAGALAGALIGILFPPALAGVLVGTAAGATIAGLVTHLWRGLARSDLHELGEAIEEGECAVVTIGTAPAIDLVESALAGATRIVRREIDADLGELDERSAG